MKNSFIYLALAFSFLLAGCEGESPIRLRSTAANTDGAREEILAMNQFDLDQCKVQLGSPALASASFQDSPAGGSVGTANAQSDRSDWNSALDKSSQLFGNDVPASPPTNAPGANINAAPAAVESVTAISILSRDDIAFARVDVVSSNSARLITNGTATVTKQVPTRRGGFDTQVGNADVSLVYNLINGSRGWMCSSVQAEVLESRAAPDDGPAPRPQSNRIGW
ncbi:MAG: hypothetical protein AB8G77_00515 [Rhodothermales bacterium]